MSRAALFPKSVIAAGVILLSFSLHLCAAFFSEGRAHPDSDYQILEFAHSKIETGVSRTLPWEFFEQIRPAVQPAIAYAVHRYATGPDPFTTVWLLRLASAALGFFSIWLLCGQALRWLNHGWSKAALVLFTGLFWLLPFLNTRFASESWAGAFLCLGIVLVLVACRENLRFALWSALTAGLVLGFAFYLRFPVALALLGLGLWLIVIERPGIRIIAAVALGFLLALGINLLLDRWFYGQWTLTPVNYFLINLVEAKAAQFGVDPWWYYIEKLLLLMVPPFSLVLLPAMIGAVILKPRNILVWTVVFFMVGHSFIDHKETRFLMPVIYPLLVLSVVGLEALFDKLALSRNIFCSSRVARLGVYLFFALNGLALAVFSFLPANQETVVHKWIYQASMESPMEIVAYGENPYDNGSGTIGFFRSPKVSFYKVGSSDELEAYLESVKETAYVFVPTAYPPAALLALCPDFALESSALPQWLRQVDRRQWLSKVRIWSIYRCSFSGA